MNAKVRAVLLCLFYAAILSAALFVISVQWRKSEGTDKGAAAVTNINSSNQRVLDYASYATSATNSDYWSTTVAVYFSPSYGGPDCTEAITNVICSAQSNVLVQAYMLTAKPIMRAMADAKRRGIDVQVIVDSQTTNSMVKAGEMADSEIPVYIDHKHRIAHNKVIIVDGVIVVSGSFNFTEAAEHANAENVMIIRSGGVAEIFTANWKKHLEHSVRMQGAE